MTIQLEQHKAFPSQQVPPRNVELWLPPGYQTNLEQRFGVLYMHDGQNLFDSALAYTGVDWGVVPALQKLAASGAIAEEVIVAGIWNTERRMPEYLPQRPFDSPTGWEKLASLGEVVGDGPYSDHYLRFLVEELKPFIDGRYRTIAGQSHTFIMGSSMGGLISLYALCEYPEIFGGAGCLSTHWPAVDELILDYLTRKLPPPGRHRIYFDYGTVGLDAQYETHQKEVDKIMWAKGYQHGKDWITQRFDGADHNEQAWRERVHIPLAFLLGRL
jgi:predicted alpha/beta superfamily hydrolase